jgi:hypothetical protein
MRLGLGSAGVNQQNDKLKTETMSWDEVGGKIGHWDFSDATTCFTTPSGATNCTNNDSIGRINNQVKVLDLNLSYLQNGGLGRDLQGVQYPTFKTGGANSKSYGEFNNSILRASQSGNIGTVATSILSNSAMAYNGACFFLVFDPSDATYTNDMYLFSLWGDGAEDGNDNTFAFGIEESADHYAVWTYDGSGAVQEHNTAIDASTGVQLITISFQHKGGVLAGTADQALLYKDGATGSGYNLDMQASTGHTYRVNQPINLLGGAMAIGHQIDTIGDPGSLAYWKGKIYEILIYNKELSLAQQRLINNHLITKYDI